MKEVFTKIVDLLTRDNNEVLQEVFFDIRKQNMYFTSTYHAGLIHKGTIYTIADNYPHSPKIPIHKALQQQFETQYLEPLKILTQHKTKMYQLLYARKHSPQELKALLPDNILQLIRSRNLDPIINTLLDKIHNCLPDSTTVVSDKDKELFFYYYALVIVT